MPMTHTKHCTPLLVAVKAKQLDQVFRKSKCTAERTHTPWKDAAWHHCKWFPRLHGKVNNAICGLVRMEPEDQRARLQLLAKLSFCPQLSVELSLQTKWV